MPRTEHATICFEHEPWQVYVSPGVDARNTFLGSHARVYNHEPIPIIFFKDGPDLVVQPPDRDSAGLPLWQLTIYNIGSYKLQDVFDYPARFWADLLTRRTA